MSSSDDADAEVAEDWRIAKLYAAADKVTPDDFAQLLDQLGTEGAVVAGSMMLDRLAARSHFVVMALLDADDGSLAECIENRRALLRATVRTGGDGAGVALVAAIESWVCSELEGTLREVAISSFDDALRALFEWDVVQEEELRSWQADERAARLLNVPQGDAIRIHDRGRVFCEWLDRGGEDAE
eukprot:scaffold45050_cov32-Tisochrysis_lutea.AAC.1